MGHRETREFSGEAEIGTLRQRIQALLDADCVLPEDGGALLAALDAALQDLATGRTPAAGAGIQRFIERAQSLMEAGVLERRAGRPPLETARALLAALRG
jgi:hypothetical protein